MKKFSFAVICCITVCCMFSCETDQPEEKKKPEAGKLYNPSNGMLTYKWVKGEMVDTLGADSTDVW